MVGGESITSATPDTGSCRGVTRFSALPQDGPVKTTPSVTASRFARRDLADLGRRFGRILARGGLALWCWAQALRVSWQADPVPLAAAGQRVGMAARKRAYSDKWMSRALIAAREWPQTPQTQAERAAFTARFHGHKPKTPSAAVAREVRIQLALRRLRRAVAELLRLGWTAQDIRRWLDAELLSAAAAQELTPPPAPPSPVARPKSTEP